MLVLLLLLIVGLPIAVVGSLMRARMILPATSGEQPGGTVEGRVLDEDGVPLAGVTVGLMIVREGHPAELHEERETGPSGAFSFDAPPLRGKYLLAAGGGEHVRAFRELSFLDPRGELVQLEPLELRLAPGCMLSVELVRASDRYDDSGRYELRGQPLEGFALGLLRRTELRAGEFEGGRIELGGLPPMEGRLLLFLDNGDEVELPLRLAAGREVRELSL